MQGIPESQGTLTGKTGWLLELGLGLIGLGPATIRPLLIQVIPGDGELDLRKIYELSLTQ